MKRLLDEILVDVWPPFQVAEQPPRISLPFLQSPCPCSLPFLLPIPTIHPSLLSLVCSLWPIPLWGRAAAEVELGAQDIQMLWHIECHIQQLGKIVSKPPVLKTCSRKTYSLEM